ncbi:MAG: hypothetical protein FWC16_01990 [Defluviitaleaceae bacterium]|nr:hypothetical protein [Defluviitaleaceae bacterium]MCL2273670.1 hypothetical protein [Defluviitaleaceae bacterium]
MPTYLTTNDLMERWNCAKYTALEAMHWEGSKAIKIGKRLLITEEGVQAYEEYKRIHNAQALKIK